MFGKKMAEKCYNTFSSKMLKEDWGVVVVVVWCREINKKMFLY